MVVLVVAVVVAVVVGVVYCVVVLVGVVYCVVVLQDDGIDGVDNVVTAMVDPQHYWVVVVAAIAVQTVLFVFVIVELPNAAFVFLGCVVPVDQSIVVQGVRCVRLILGWQFHANQPNRDRLRRCRRRLLLLGIE